MKKLLSLLVFALISSSSSFAEQIHSARCYSNSSFSVSIIEYKNIGYLGASQLTATVYLNNAIVIADYKVKLIGLEYVDSETSGQKLRLKSTSEPVGYFFKALPNVGAAAGAISQPVKCDLFNKAVTAPEAT